LGEFVVGWGFVFGVSCEGKKTDERRNGRTEEQRKWVSKLKQRSQLRRLFCSSVRLLFS